MSVGLRLVMLTALALALAGILACGGDEEETTGPVRPDYWPSKKGDNWTYATTDSAEGSYETSIWFAGKEKRGGVECQVLITTRSDLFDEGAYRYVVDNGTSAVRCYGEDYYVGTRRTYENDFVADTFQYPLKVDAEWSVYQEEGVQPSAVPFMRLAGDDWDDDGVDDTCDVTIRAEVQAQEDVTVPAGTFVDCFRVRYESDVLVHLSKRGDAHIYDRLDNWFKPTVGVVKSYCERDWPRGKGSWPADWERTSELTAYSLH